MLVFSKFRTTGYDLLVVATTGGEKIKCADIILGTLLHVHSKTSHFPILSHLRLKSNILNIFFTATL